MAKQWPAIDRAALVHPWLTSVLPCANGDTPNVRARAAASAAKATKSTSASPRGSESSNESGRSLGSAAANSNAALVGRSMANSLASLSLDAAVRAARRCLDENARCGLPSCMVLCGVYRKKKRTRTAPNRGRPVSPAPRARHGPAPKPRASIRGGGVPSPAKPPPRALSETLAQRHAAMVWSGYVRNGEPRRASRMVVRAACMARRQLLMTASCHSQSITPFRPRRSQEYPQGRHQCAARALKDRPGPRRYQSGRQAAWHCRSRNCHLIGQELSRALVHLVVVECLRCTQRAAAAPIIRTPTDDIITVDITDGPAAAAAAVCRMQCIALHSVCTLYT
jgi:hypothetical protein